MSAKRKRIPSKIKAEILTALSKPDCIMSQLARTYGISVFTISQWRKEYQEVWSNIRQECTQVNNFAEVSVKEEGDKKLQKASLTFNNVTISIEGGIRSETLVEIIKLVEGRC